MVIEQLGLPSAPPPSGANYSAEHGCFEGPEKLLEIWFSPSPETPRLNNADNSDSDMSDISNPPTPREAGLPLGVYPDLRTVDKATWDAMLATVKCTVLSVLQNDYVDSYLLSESSMFVYPHKLVLKTCGTTTLLKALPYILEIAKSRCGFERVYRFFYSRKSFMFPEKQPGPHRSWEEEVNYLDNHFDNGAAYVVGDTNVDEWYLYLTSPRYDEHTVDMQQLLMETDGMSWMAEKDCSWEKMSRSLQQQHAAVRSSAYRTHDETIEILMTDLDPVAMQPFYQQDGEPSGLKGGKRVDIDTGLRKVYPAAKADSFLFEPCGYSSNGLLEDGYYSIHVTPEPQCSYASFETTIPAHLSHPIQSPGKRSSSEESVCRLIRQVVDIFQPGSFTITYFSANKAVDGKDPEDNVNHLMRTMGQYGGYKRKDRILHEFDGYDFIFGHYKRI
ncbi:spermidine resistance protein [Apophysomyces sp. BC1034]|nr:spermidine resistance protein [Apophysomyces sp. BC1015]KAG0173730.1 spermidine resistance protein [Apophysomyces sp. BC1021]KAG0185597.1 spermidine resistance protein [Apophysomyces sp. BC1034]